MDNFKVMIFNAIVLIALGVYGYTLPPHSPTALIAPAIGLVLFILAFPIKKENHIAAHIGVGLTGLAFAAFTVTGIMRSNIYIIIMAVVTLFAFIFYITDFFRRKAERKKTV
ncbi:MAG: hypothetical protein HY959_11580 [Ignavibacteriae bacterium]|nr:hypothetical protein [Ignavibacteriota bacterium]